MIPKPFARVTVAYSAPISITEKTTDAALQRGDEVKTGIMSAERAAAESV